MVVIVKLLFCCNNRAVLFSDDQSLSDLRRHSFYSKQNIKHHIQSFKAMKTKSIHTNRRSAFSFCLLSFVLSLSLSLSALSQIPLGFNYQAIARDGATGNPITNATIKVKLSVLTDTTGFYLNGGAYQWEEEHTGVKTDSYGMFTVVLGHPSAVRIQGVPRFSAINWSLPVLYVGTKIAQAPAYLYKIMGASRLWSVPYSLASSTILGDLGKLSVIGINPSLEDALFEVKNFNGKTVFAVYNEGVRIYVDDGSKGAKGGFAIGGFDGTKLSPVEYLRVTRDSTRINVNQNLKGAKGGFAIGGFDASKKSEPEDFLNVTPENTFIGYKTGYSNTTGLYNSFIGYESGKFNLSGSNNVFLGYNAGLSNTAGNSNVFVGNRAGYSNSTGLQNVFVGNGSGEMNTEGEQNVFIGTVAGKSNSTGSSNIFIGAGTGYHSKTTLNNIFIGGFAGYYNTTSSSNIFIGKYAGYMNSTGSSNLFIGDNSGESNTEGGSNTFVGNNSGKSNTTGGSNSFFGPVSGYRNTTGYENSYIGGGAGLNNTNGTRNTYLGLSSGGGGTTGHNNVYLGHSAGAGSGVNGSNNIFLGYRAGFNETGSNRLYIENSDNDSNNALIYGEFDNDIIKLNGTVNIRDVLKLEPRSSAPSSPEAGDIYFNSVTKKLMVFDGTAWQACW